MKSSGPRRVATAIVIVRRHAGPMTESQARRVEPSVTFRLTEDDRNRIKREAAAAGLTVQQLFELRMLGAPRSARRPGRRPNYPNPGQEVLPAAM